MKKLKLRSKEWFDNPKDPGLTAIYLERYLNYGLTRKDLQSGKPIIGIAQSGSDLSPCNRHILSLSDRIKKGVRDAGGVPMEFPTHPIQETGKRPTAALDRNLSYLSLVEVLYGYPLDGVILTTGCDKTTPAALMAAATVNIPAIVLSGGPMLDGHYKGKKAGSGTIIWEARKLYSKGKIDYDEFMDMATASSPSVGHCNTMGTASTMNSIAEALGMSLPGCAIIPAPYPERKRISYQTGKRIVGMVKENLTPSKIMTKKSFENAVVVASALGGSSNAVSHLIAIAKHMNIKFNLSDWQKLGHKIPLLVNCQPAGEYLIESILLLPRQRPHPVSDSLQKRSSLSLPAGCSPPHSTDFPPHPKFLGLPPRSQLPPSPHPTLRRSLPLLTVADRAVRRPAPHLRTTRTARWLPRSKDSPRGHGRTFGTSTPPPVWCTRRPDR